MQTERHFPPNGLKLFNIASQNLACKNWFGIGPANRIDFIQAVPGLSGSLPLSERFPRYHADTGRHC